VEEKEILLEPLPDIGESYFSFLYEGKKKNILMQDGRGRKRRNLKPVVDGRLLLFVTRGEGQLSPEKRRGEEGSVSREGGLTELGKAFLLEGSFYFVARGLCSGQEARCREGDWVLRGESPSASRGPRLLTTTGLRKSKDTALELL